MIKARTRPDLGQRSRINKRRKDTVPAREFLSDRVDFPGGRLNLSAA